MPVGEGVLQTSGGVLMQVPPLSVSANMALSYLDVPPVYIHLSGGADVGVFRAQAIGGAHFAADAARLAVGKVVHVFFQRGVVSAAPQDALSEMAADGLHDGKALQEEMNAALEGKTGEERQKVMEDFTSRMNVVRSEAQNKLKASLDTALNEVAKEKGLGAVLIKDAVPQGGVDVTQDVIAKMK